MGRREDLLLTPWTGRRPWTQAPGKPPSGPPCKHTEASQTPPCREAPNWPGGGRRSYLPQQCFWDAPGGGGASSGGTKVIPRKYRSSPSAGNLPRPLTWYGLPNRWGDSIQVTHVVIPRYGADGAPYREGFHRNLHHRREALIRQLPTGRQRAAGPWSTVQPGTENNERRGCTFPSQSTPRRVSL